MIILTILLVCAIGSLLGGCGGGGAQEPTAVGAAVCIARASDGSEMTCDEHWPICHGKDVNGNDVAWACPD